MFNKGKYVPKTKPSVFQQKREAEEKEFRRYYPQRFKAARKDTAFFDYYQVSPDCFYKVEKV